MPGIGGTERTPVGNQSHPTSHRSIETVPREVAPIRSKWKSAHLFAGSVSFGLSFRPLVGVAPVCQEHRKTRQRVSPAACYDRTDRLSRALRNIPASLNIHAAGEARVGPPFPRSAQWHGRRTRISARFFSVRSEARAFLCFSAAAYSR